MRGKSWVVLLDELFESIAESLVEINRSTIESTEFDDVAINDVAILLLFECDEHWDDGHWGMLEFAHQYVRHPEGIDRLWGLTTVEVGLG